MKTAKRHSTARISVALAALWLSACGGGGGGGDAPAAAPSGLGAPAPATAAPTPATAAPTPAAPAPVAGTPTAAPATALAWAPAASLPSTTWHWVASNPAGTVLAATVIPGNVYLSRDSGATWNASTLPDANWISLDMDATGQTMVAVAFGGGMYRSTNGGTTWTQIDTAFNAGNNLQYESVTVSQNGQRVVATVLNGPIHVSVNGGNTFTTAGGSAAGANPWRGIDSSADGAVVVAVTQGQGTAPGAVHLSTDGGLTFALRPVPLGGLPNAGGWYRVAVSDDGNTIAVAGNTDFAGTSTGLFVSRDRGLTWVQGNVASGAYTSIDMSATGDVIAATMSGATGQVLLSTNGGTSFSPITTPAGETNWRALAMDAAATRLILAAGTFPSNTAGVNGQVYLSSGTVAAPAPAPAPAPAATPAATPASAPASAPATTPAGSSA
jgi:hypothetical protein